MRQQLVQHFPQVADQRNIHFDVLVDLRRIDLNVDLFGIGSIGFQISRDPVIESHAEGEQQIRFLDGVVHPGFAVHAHHAQIERMRRGKRTDAQQG